MALLVSSAGSSLEVPQRFRGLSDMSPSNDPGDLSQLEKLQTNETWESTI